MQILPYLWIQILPYLWIQMLLYLWIQMLLPQQVQIHLDSFHYGNCRAVFGESQTEVKNSLKLRFSYGFRAWFPK